MSIRGRLLTLVMGGVLPLLLVGLTALWFVWSEKRNQLNESLEQQSELLAVVFDRGLASGQTEREGVALETSFRRWTRALHRAKCDAADGWAHHRTERSWARQYIQVALTSLAKWRMH